MNLSDFNIKDNFNLDVIKVILSIWKIIIDSIRKKLSK